MRYKKYLDICSLEKLQEAFNENQTIKEVSQLYRVPQKRLSDIVKYYNLDVKRKGVIYKIEEDFFKDINSELKAYLLGFIVADGNISKPSNRKMRLSFNNSIDDLKVIELMRDNLIPNYEIKIINKSTENIKRKDTIIFRLNSNILCNDLINLYGITPNKTLNKEFIINNIPNKYFKDFVRGFFDGDGSVGRNSLDFVGTSLPFLTQIKDFFESNGFSSYRFYKEEGKTIVYYRLYINMNKSNKEGLYNLLYKDAKYFLERKKDKIYKHKAIQNVSLPNV